jgi:hypothetical protein
MQGNVIPVEGSWELRLLWKKVEVRIVTSGSGTQSIDSLVHCGGGERSHGNHICVL